MGIPSGCDPWSLSVLPGIKLYQVQHSPDTLRGTFSGIQRSAAKKLTCLGFTPGNDAVGLIKAVGSRDLGDVQMLHAKHVSTLMPRFAEQFKMYFGLECAQNGSDLRMVVKYDGEPFDVNQSDDQISLAILKHVTDEINYSEIAEDGYINKVEITIKERRDVKNAD